MELQFEGALIGQCQMDLFMSWVFLFSLSDPFIKLIYTLTLSCTITAFHVSTLSVQSRLLTCPPYPYNHNFSRIYRIRTITAFHVSHFQRLKNRLFRRCLKSMIYETISVKYYLYFGVSKPICLFFGKGIDFQREQNRKFAK